MSERRVDIMLSKVEEIATRIDSWLQLRPHIQDTIRKLVKRRQTKTETAETNHATQFLRNLLCQCILRGGRIPKPPRKQRWDWERKESKLKKVLFNKDYQATEIEDNDEEDNESSSLESLQDGDRPRNDKGKGKATD